MSEPDDKGAQKEGDLYLIKVPGRDSGDQERYLVCERVFTVDPEQSVMDIPWSELQALFKGRTLPAVPIPSKGRGRRSFVSEAASTHRGASTRVEVNLIKVERKSD